jgi:hypothetical protein
MAGGQQAFVAEPVDARGEQVADETGGRVVREAPARGKGRSGDRLNRVLGRQSCYRMPRAAANGGGEQVNDFTTGHEEQVQPRMIGTGLDQLGEELLPPLGVGSSGRIEEEVVDLIDRRVGNAFAPLGEAAHEVADGQPRKPGWHIVRRPGPQQPEGERVVTGKGGERERPEG